MHQQVLDQIMVANLNDEAQSWTLDADGALYAAIRAWDRPNAFSAHEYFMTNPSPLRARAEGEGPAARVRPCRRREARPPPHDAAVIDVGSNSVRLVLYRLEGRAIWTVYNEKVLAGLGRDLPRTGRLSPEGGGGGPAGAAPLPRRARRRRPADDRHASPPPPCARPTDGPDFVAQGRRRDRASTSAC